MSPLRPRSTKVWILATVLALVVPAVGLALSGSTAPSPARDDAASAASDDPLPGRSWERSHDADDGAASIPRSPLAVFAERVDPDDPATFRDALHDAWSAAPGPDPVRVEAVAASASSSSEYTGTARLAFPAGDLDADGADDASILEIDTSDFSLRLEGRDGASGASHWDVPLATSGSPALAVAQDAGDLDADGRDDLLVGVASFGAYSSEQDCTLDVCRSESQISYALRFEARSGADGSELWSRAWTLDRSQDTVFTYRDEAGVDAAARVDVRRMDNALAFPKLAGDVDGDGNPDVVLNVQDLVTVTGSGTASTYTEGVATYAFADGDVHLSATRAEAVRGADGATLVAREDPLGPGEARLEAAGQAVGNARADLLWHRAIRPDVRVCALAVVESACADDAPARLEAEMVDGSTGDAAWTRSIPLVSADYVAASALQADLDADGSDDVKVVVQSDADDRTEMLSGADGTTLWTRAERVGGVLGPVGGAPGNDLVVDDLRYDHATHAYELVLSRIDGTTGTVLFSTVHGGADGRLPSHVRTDADADGDGVRDLALRIRDVDETRFVVESGADGSELLAIDRSPDARILDAADLDADGRDDLVLRTVSYDHRYAVDLEGVDADGNTLWTLEDLEDAYPAVAGDLVGDGGADLLVSRISIDDQDHVTSRVDAYRGEDAVKLWSVGSL